MKSKAQDILDLIKNIIEDDVKKESRASKIINQLEKNGCKKKDKKKKESEKAD